jgi:hypothetical protein
MYKSLTFFVLMWITLCLVSGVSAELHISEIYPAPTSGEFEWVELVNTGNPVSTSGYSLTDATGKKLVLPTTTVATDQYVVATTSGTLNNDTDTLKLIRLADSFLLESITYNGTFTAAQTWTLCPTGWKLTSILTKAQPNDPSCILPTATPSPTVTPTRTPTIPPEPTSLTPTLSATPPGHDYSGLIISEVNPVPVSGSEWIELFNGSNHTIQLDDLAIDDTQGGGGSAQDLSGVIESGAYFTYTLHSPLFNNSGDTATLATQDGNVIDATAYPTISKGQTWGRTINTQDASFCTQTASPGVQNTVCSQNTPTPPPARAAAVRSTSPPTTKNQPSSYTPEVATTEPIPASAAIKKSASYFVIPASTGVPDLENMQANDSLDSSSSVYLPIKFAALLFAIAPIFTSFNFVLLFILQKQQAISRSKLPYPYSHFSSLGFG